MRIVYGPRFLRDYAGLPAEIQRRTDKQLRLLLDNPRHRSLRIRKMEGFQNVWEARVAKNYRFTFQIIDDAFVLMRIGTHDILKRS
ncbi:MAG: hypothetical protein HY644_02990 [Acidobacteria bacterium]|nr:hypothetical protein [Acidobacteriota bacterium]